MKFKLPDQILNEAPFVVVEQMPLYPGGDVELLNFIKNNTKYPEEAKAEKIEGRVIIRFIVSTEGNAEGISVLKGVHPFLMLKQSELSPCYRDSSQECREVSLLMSGIWCLLILAFLHRATFLKNF